MVDMQNNEYMPLGDHDWFTIGNEELEGANEDGVDDRNEDTDLDDVSDKDKSTDSGYSWIRYQ